VGEDETAYSGGSYEEDVVFYGHCELVSIC
jgi:hypothetical protein